MKTYLPDSPALLVILLALFFVSALPSITDQEISKSIRTNKIELVDANGKVRASIKVEEGGEAVFRLTDQEGQIRVKLGASRDGSGLVLLNDATDPGIHALSKATGTSLTLLGKDGQKKVIVP